MRCAIPIFEGEHVISTYQPNAVKPLVPNPPLHAKECARKVFDDNIQQFIDTMQLDGIDPDKIVDADTLDFDF